MQLEVSVRIGLQSFCDHNRAPETGISEHVLYGQRKSMLKSHIQIRASDTDVDDGLDLFASVSLPFATSHLFRELLHVLEDGVDFLDDTLAIDLHGLVGNIAQGDVVDRTVLCEVDGFSLEHSIAKLLQFCLLSEIHKKRKGLISDEVFGEVKQDLRLIRRVGKGTSELLETLGVLFEVFLQDNVLAQGIVVLLESLPGIQIGGLRETRHRGSLDGIRVAVHRMLRQCGAHRYSSINNSEGTYPETTKEAITYIVVWKFNQKGMRDGHGV